MKLRHCHNFADFRKLSQQRLPAPIFHYIDGAADDEKTYKRNTEAFDTVDLVPNVLAGVEKVDMSVTVMGQNLSMPIYCAPTALQRLFHHEGERAVAGAATKFGTMFGVSSLATVTVEEIGKIATGPKMLLSLGCDPATVEADDIMAFAISSRITAWRTLRRTQSMRMSGILRGRHARVGERAGGPYIAQVGDALGT